MFKDDAPYFSHDPKHSPRFCLFLQEEEDPTLRTRTSVLVQVVIQPLSFEVCKSSLGTVACEFICILGGGNL